MESISANLFVEFFFNLPKRAVSYYEMVPAEKCTPKQLSLLAKEHGALFCVCPQKYGCKQFPGVI